MKTAWLKRSKPRRRHYRRRPILESLESRWLLTATPITGELLVNSITALVQQTGPQSQAVGVQPSGDFIVTFSGNGTGDLDGVFFERFTSDGTRIGSQVRVNTTTIGVQTSPSVAVADDGSFVITWSGRGAGDHEGIFMQRYAADGTPIGGETLVNTTTLGVQKDPAIAMADDGSFVIAWSGRGAGGVEGIYLQAFNANGTHSGGETLVSTSNSFEQAHPSIAFNGEQIVVAWSSRLQDGSGWGVFARVFDAAGNALSGELLVNATTASDQMRPSVAMSDDGFMIAWSSRGQNGGTNFDVFARQFSSTGVAMGGEFQINSTIVEHQHFVQLSAGPGGYTMTWMSALQDGSGWGIFARQFDHAGAPLGDEFLVNVTTIASQRFPSVGQNAEGVLVFAWSGAGAGDSTGVFARVFSTDGEIPSEPNRPPDLDPIADQEIEVGQELTFTATATDPDGDNLTFQLGAGAPDGATIDMNTGVFSWTPTADQVGTHVITVIVNDDGNPPLSDQETFTVTVLPTAVTNNPPNLEPIPDQEIEVGQELTFTATATDPDGDNLTFQLGAGAPAGVTIDMNTGVFSWTPTADQVGTHVITVIVNDDGNPPLSDQETFTVTVLPAMVQNNPPNLQPIDDQEAGIGAEVRIELFATDPDGDAIHYQIGAGSAFFGTEHAPMIEIIGEQVFFVWTPPETGTFAFTVIVSDDGNPPLSDQESFTITVFGAPTATDDQFTVEQDSEGNSFNVLQNDSAVEGDLDPTTVTIVQSPTNGTATVDAETGAIIYTPTADFFGFDTFTYTVRDERGALSNEATVTITVLPAEPGPFASDDEFTVDRNSEENVLDVLANDSAFPDDHETLMIIDVGEGDMGGTIVIAADGRSLLYTPAADFFGTETFTYTVEDAHGGTDTATVVVTVFSGNAPPEAVDDGPFTVEPGESLEITVLLNDTAEGEIDPTTVTITLQPTAGTATVDPATGLITYTAPAAPELQGTYFIGYTVQDTEGQVSEPAVVTVIVAFDPPVAVLDLVSISDRETPVQINVLANDMASAGIDPTTVTLLIEPDMQGILHTVSGTVTLDPVTGIVTYTPNPNIFLFSDTFEYTFQDVEGRTSNVGIVNIVLEPGPGGFSDGDADPTMAMALLPPPDEAIDATSDEDSPPGANVPPMPENDELVGEALSAFVDQIDAPPAGDDNGATDEPSWSEDAVDEALNLLV